MRAPAHRGPYVPVPPLLLGAVNPAMVRLAAELADGVVTWSAAEATFRELIALAAASAASGFRVVASLPVSVTHDVRCSTVPGQGIQ